MSERPTYSVSATRNGKWWTLEAEEVPFGLSQCRRLDQADEMIREAIAIALDVPEDSFDVEITPELEPQVAEAISCAKAMQAEAERMSAEARRQAREVTRELVEGCELSMRDAGTILGISHQRVHQVLAEGAEAS